MVCNKAHRHGTDHDMNSLMPDGLRLLMVAERAGMEHSQQVCILITPASRRKGAARTYKDDGGLQLCCHCEERPHL